MLKVKFVGAIHGVTGSCSWLWHTESDTQLLIDCGIHQGPHHIEWLNRKAFPFKASEIQYVLLTHAHLDHCGLIPKLVSEGFRGWVYCTQATKEVAKELLADAAKISQLYSQNDVEGINWHAIDGGEFSWGRILTLADDLIATYNRGSHVLGGCSISVSWAKNTGAELKDFASIHFSGDLGCQTDDNPYLPLLKADHRPYPKADYIVTESTYGNRRRDSKCWQTRTSLLATTIARTVFLKGGKVLIPSFAFHRMQELIADLWTIASKQGAIPQEGLPEKRRLKVACHSPLSNRINRVYSDQLGKRLKNGKFQYLSDELPLRASCCPTKIGELFRDLHEGREVSNGTVTFRMSSTRSKSSAGNSCENLLNDADVVLASSGMCDSGPSKEYLSLLRDSPKNTIIISGFQASGSAGKELLEDSDSGAEVVDMSSYYSGHGDQLQLLDNVFELAGYASESKKATIFINHGEPEAKKALKQAILDRATENRFGDRKIEQVLIAQDNWFDLNSCAEIPEEKDPEAIKAEIERLQTLLDVG
ncbi:MBL fold metallo-hydrolase [Marinobacter salinexigens]|uniref:MBL fold metallo-hydrolase n=1 Tax=Marinobacter salinexigens TaxID=2919747 RepID=A0A5B0VDK8_9GAMM|nr:MBL fold metallo-hydrolase [Marinobacter salinexigens]KAA1172796.1 MBL fold metallo-hydrolase [Marinobacter salinexigens]